MIFSRFQERSGDDLPSVDSTDEIEFGILFDGTQIIVSPVKYTTEIKIPWQKTGSLFIIWPSSFLTDSSTPSCLTSSSSPQTHSHGPQIGWAADGKVIILISDSNHLTGFPIYGPWGHDGEMKLCSLNSQIKTSRCLDRFGGREEALPLIDRFQYRCKLISSLFLTDCR
jgi:hypothetical protein